MDNAVYIYTDGSCIERGKGCGWAAKLIYNGHSKTVSGGDRGKTNNQMEMVAVLNALRAVKDKCIHTELYSDSDYIVNTLNWKYCIGANEKLWDEILQERMKFKDIRFFWVKSHGKDRHNAEVDKAAFAAAKARKEMDNDKT